MRLTIILASLVSLAGCGDDDGSTDAGPADGGTPDTGPVEFVPDGYCPGGPDCADMGDMVLRVGVARVAYTPTIGAMTDVQTVDVNMNGEYDPRDGDMYD